MLLMGHTPGLAVEHLGLISPPGTGAHALTNCTFYLLMAHFGICFSRGDAATFVTVNVHRGVKRDCVDVRYLFADGP